MDAQRYDELAEGIAAIDQDCWVTGPEECRALVERLSSLSRPLNSGGNP